MTSLICSQCAYPGPFRVCGDGKTNGRLYGKNPDDSILCDVCCGVQDKKSLLETGKAFLYLSVRDYGIHGPLGVRYAPATLSNWPGTFKIEIPSYRTGRHNFAGIRFDIWFSLEGQNFHGVTYGENTQICHVRRVKG